MDIRKHPGKVWRHAAIQDTYARSLSGNLFLFSKYLRTLTVVRLLVARHHPIADRRLNDLKYRSHSTGRSIRKGPPRLATIANPSYWPKPNQSKLLYKAMTICIRTLIVPPKEPTQPTTNDRRDEPISPLVRSHDLHRFFFLEKAMRCREMLQSDRNLLATFGLNVANPVGITTKPIYHYDFGPLMAILDYLQDGLATQPAFSADMRQQQAAMAEEPTEMPAVQVDGSSEEIPQRTVPSNRAHLYPYPPINAPALSASGMQVS